MTDTLTPASTNNPRIALMGEFSAGKSTLANLLLERQYSPVQVTATQLPPVWYRKGEGASHRITKLGERVSIPGGEWGTVSVDDTQMIEIGLDAEILNVAELIDMPGTSDPNLTVQYWKHILPQVDLVVWCTPANQAWRQSEAALWEQVAPDLQSRSLLLITRMDKIRGAMDGARILQRVRYEAERSFASVLPVSLTQAMMAGEDEKALEACGAAEMVRFLVSAIEQVAPNPRAEFVPFVEELPKPVSSAVVTPIPAKTAGRIIPRRVISKRVARG